LLLLLFCCQADAVVLVYDDQFRTVWFDEKDGLPKSRHDWETFTRLVGLQVQPMCRVAGEDAGRILQMLAVADIAVAVSGWRACRAVVLCSHARCCECLCIAMLAQHCIALLLNSRKCNAALKSIHSLFSGKMQAHCSLLPVVQFSQPSRFGYCYCVQCAKHE
jgi:hypothetical protein